MPKWGKGSTTERIGDRSTGPNSRQHFPYTNSPRRSRSTERYQTGGSRLRDSRDIYNRRDTMVSIDNRHSARTSYSGKREYYADSPRFRPEYGNNSHSPSKRSLRSPPRYSEDNWYTTYDGRITLERKKSYEWNSDDDNNNGCRPPRASSVSSYDPSETDDELSYEIPRTCTYYNAKGCNKPSCPFLHICKYFVIGDCKFGNKCARSHDLFDPQPSRILNNVNYHLPANEAEKLQLIASAEFSKSKFEWKMESRNGTLKLYPEDELQLERKYQQYLKAKRSTIVIDGQEIKMDFSKMKGRSSRNREYRLYRDSKKENSY